MTFLIYWLAASIALTAILCGLIHKAKALDHE